MARLSDLSDDELLTALDVKEENRSPVNQAQDRVVAGFEEIQRFVAETGRTPQHGEGRDIFERLYAVRLDRLRTMAEYRAVLEPLDHQGLLRGDGPPAVPIDSLDDDALLAELDVAEDPTGIRDLRHVRPRADIQAAEEIANREKCRDFARFKPRFAQVQEELQAGIRESRAFGKDASVAQGTFFILGGQLVYVAEVGERLRAPNGETDARLRLIYANGTESNLLRRSLQRALYKDEGGRRLTEPNLGPLFSDAVSDADIESGTIYVLRSQSDHPFVAENRETIHKIGVTGGPVQARIAHAAHEATYLLADVEVVATYKLVNIRRTRLEALLHRIFAAAQLDLTIHDRFGTPVHPREWFLVPLHVIDEAVQRIRDGSITEVTYDPQSAALVPVPH